MDHLFRSFSEYSDAQRTPGQLRFRRIVQYFLLALASLYALMALTVTVMRVTRFPAPIFIPYADKDFAIDFFNMSGLSLALLVLAVQIVGTVFGNEHQNYSNRLFVFCLYSASFNLFLNFCYNAVDGIPAPFAVFLNYFCHSLYLLVNFVCIAIYALYFSSLFAHVTKYMVYYRIVIHCYLIFCVAILLANIKYGFLFYLDKTGTCHQGPLSNLHMAVIAVFILGMVPFPFLQKIDKVERTAILTFLAAPLLGMFMQLLVPGIIFSPISIFLGICILFVYTYLRSNQLAHKQQLELRNQQTAIMLSQIQPHFLFNSLSSVAMLCDSDPGKAKKTAITFTRYLRGNLASLSAKDPIPFEDELYHTKAYLEIESVRFGKWLNIEFDIRTTDFKIPSLTLQPLVENAVKHGVCMKPEGGTVWISTYETPDSYVVEIRDDGVGFDVNDPELENDVHVGIRNVRSRIKEQADGILLISSTPGVGTVSKIILPKEEIQI